jgi:hypothetical protein
MSAGIASRVAALGHFAITVGEMSGDAAAKLLEMGERSPIGSGHPVEAFTVCGIGAGQLVFNTMMPPNMQMRARITFDQQPQERKWHRVARWDNESRDRTVITIYVPDREIFLSMCLSNGKPTPNMQRPIQSRTPSEAKLAHNVLVEMVQQGQL